MNNPALHPTFERLMLAAKETRKLVKKADVARLLNVSDQVLKNWEKRGMSKNGMLAAQQVLGCSATWLETGEGQMMTGPGYSTATQLLRRDGVLMPPVSEYVNVTEVPGPARAFEYPEISEVQAGSAAEAIDLLQPGEGKRHQSDVWAGPHGFWLRVSGDSMTRSSGLSLNEGMLVLVDPNVDAISGRVIIAKRKGEVTMKQYVMDAGVRMLKAWNPAFPKQVQVMDESWDYVGTVVDAKWPKGVF